MAVDLEAEIDRVLERATQVEPNAHWGISVIHRSYGRNETVFAVDEHDAFPAFSLGKLVVDQALSVQTGLTPAIAREFLTVGPESWISGGTGFLQIFPDGFSVNMRDVVRLMRSESDSTAAKMIVNRLGGVDETNDLFTQAGHEFEVSGLEDLGSGRIDFGQTTANESARLFASILPVGSRAFGDFSRSHMWYGLRSVIDDNDEEPELMGLSDFDQLELRVIKVLGKVGIHRSATARLAGRILNARWPESLYPSKEGSGEEETGYRHDVAQIGRFTIAALSEGWNPDLPYGPDHPAHRVHAALGRTMLSYQAA